jgi:heme/copper-type cytochrome/quinol oxidase subunit 3
MFVWWRDIIREATFEGQHTADVQIGMRWGMLLFIVSEIMFSLHFFGHSSILVYHRLMILVGFTHLMV